MKIAIRFTDNDFQITIVKFLEIMLEGLKDDFRETYRMRTEPEVPDKSVIVDIFNKTAPGIYLMVQSGFVSKEFNPYDYIQITENNVFIGDEVQIQKDKESVCYNGEFFILDTEVGVMSF